jgi:hypothetical protein
VYSRKDNYSKDSLRILQQNKGNIPLFISDAPDTDLAGYPFNLKAGYRISCRIPGKNGYPAEFPAEYPAQHTDY